MAPDPADDALALTVVVPVQSMSSLLRHCLTALVPQLAAGDRVVIVDDGSRDDSAEVARAAGAVVVVGDGASGPYAARNLGAAVATTPLLLFVDARCVPQPGLLDAHRALLADPAVALSCSAVRIVTGGTFAGDVSAAIDAFRLDTKVGVPGQLDFFPTANLGVRRSAFAAVGGFEVTRSGGDALLCWAVQAAGLGGMRADPRPLMHWTARGSLRGLAEQTFRYGRSAKRLEAAHGSALRLVAERSDHAPAALEPSRVVRPPQGSPLARATAASFNLAFRMGRLVGAVDERLARA